MCFYIYIYIYICVYIYICSSVCFGVETRNEGVPLRVRPEYICHIGAWILIRSWSCIVVLSLPGSCWLLKYEKPQNIEQGGDSGNEGCERLRV